MLREAACFQLAQRLFQSFTPLNEKDFLPFSVPVGNLRSANVLCSLYEVFEPPIKQTTPSYTEPRSFGAHLDAQRNHYVHSPVHKKQRFHAGCVDLLWLRLGS